MDIFGAGHIGRIEKNKARRCALALFFSQSILKQNALAKNIKALSRQKLK